MSTSVSAPPASTPPAASTALASLALTMLLSSLGTSIANVGLPTFVHVFDASFQSVQWIVLAYLLAVTAVVVTAGRLGDLVGRHRLVLVGISVFTLGSALCAMAPSLGFLIAARTAQGLGAAVMMAMTMALVGEAVTKERTGRAMGLLGTTSAIGTALGPTLGGMLIGSAGWQAIFLVNLPLGLVAAGLVWRFLPRDTVAGKARFDIPGSLLLAIALVAYSLAMTLGHGHFGVTNIALGGTAFLATIGFLVVESKAPSPLVRLSLFRDMRISAGFAASSLATSVAMTTLVVGPFYLSGALHLEPVRIGLVMSTGPLVAALVGIPAGKAVDRFGAARMSLMGLIAMTLGALLLSVMAVRHGALGYIVPLVTLTAGFATFQAANNTLVVAGTDAPLRGVVSGLLNLSRNLGLVTGASLMGAIFMRAAGVSSIEGASTSAVVIGTHAAFLTAAAFLAFALVLTGWSNLSPASEANSHLS
ncbi:MAG: MFS transporter [Dokdonella sp.]